jgi:miniconductance mechanosensitive channel
MAILFSQILPESVISLFQDKTWLVTIYNITVIFVFAMISWFAAKRLLLRTVKYFVGKTKNKWDDVLYEKKVFSRLANIAPAVVVYWFAPVFQSIESGLKRATVAYMVLVVMFVFKSLSNAFLEIYESSEIAKEKPLKGIVQTAVLIIYIIGFIVIIAVLMGKSPALILSGLGAMTAVLMLVFRDTILGFVAGVQISSSNSIRKGDWIVMKKFDADGEVIDIALHSIKIQNWDKTIVSIPSHKFLEESFTNWRGMQESGGRRICRNLNIDLTSVHYLSQEEIEKLKKIHLISDYIDRRLVEITQWNTENKADTSVPVNGRKLTNIGTFRHYIKNYLAQNKKIRKDMTLLVRQLQPNEHGIPLQIYVFTDTTVWAEYEDIQSDIFDHLIASSQYFGLTLYQNPSGNDFRKLGKGYGTN